MEATASVLFVFTSLNAVCQRPPSNCPSAIWAKYRFTWADVACRCARAHQGRINRSNSAIFELLLRRMDDLMPLE
jgi:hypothetical protein